MYTSVIFQGNSCIHIVFEVAGTNARKATATPTHGRNSRKGKIAKTPHAALTNLLYFLLTDLAETTRIKLTSPCLVGVLGIVTGTPITSLELCEITVNCKFTAVRE